MNRPATPLFPALWTGLLCILATGCIPKPNTLATRNYLLTPIPATVPDGTRTPQEISVGVGIVRLPAYLLKPSLVERSGTNEITYLESSLWAERLDTLFQRTLASNLSTLIPTDAIRISSWSRGEVARAVYVSVDRFDVDAQGVADLSAWWRVTSGDSEGTLTNGGFHATLKGPSPSVDPAGAANTLSLLTARFSETLAGAVRDSAPPSTR